MKRNPTKYKWKSKNILEKSKLSFHLFRLKNSIKKKEIWQDDPKILLVFIEEIIDKLEKKMAAESICKITSIHKEGGIVKYETHLEDYDNRYRWIDSKVIEELDKLRENSLFSIYTIAHKSPFSLISQNVFFN